MHRFFGSMLKISAVSAAALAAVSCGASDNDPGPGGVTVGEARALDDAAEMLDERNADPAAASAEQDADPTGPGAGPATGPATGPAQ